MAQAVLTILLGNAPKEQTSLRPQADLGYCILHPTQNNHATAHNNDILSRKSPACDLNLL